MKLLGLIFDLDGTLMDSAADMRQALNTLLAAHNRRALTLSEVKNLTGDGLNAMLHRAFAITGGTLSNEKIAVLFDPFLRLYNNQKASRDQLYPLVLETLQSYRAKGIRIGLCTNKVHAATVKLLNDMRLTDLFDGVAGGDRFAMCKPHPMHVLGVADLINAPPKNCIMIGDSINDIRAARAAQITSIAVAHGYGADICKLDADTVISGFAQLPDAISSLGFDIVG